MMAVSYPIRKELDEERIREEETRLGEAVLEVHGAGADRPIVAGFPEGRYLNAWCWPEGEGAGRGAGARAGGAGGRASVARRYRRPPLPRDTSRCSVPLPRFGGEASTKDEAFDGFAGPNRGSTKRSLSWPGHG